MPGAFFLAGDEPNHKLPAGSPAPQPVAPQVIMPVPPGTRGPVPRGKIYGYPSGAAKPYPGRWPHNVDIVERPVTGLPREAREPFASGFGSLAIVSGIAATQIGAGPAHDVPRPLPAPGSYAHGPADERPIERDFLRAALRLFRVEREVVAEVNKHAEQIQDALGTKLVNVGIEATGAAGSRLISKFPATGLVDQILVGTAGSGEESHILTQQEQEAALRGVVNTFTAAAMHLIRPDYVDPPAPSGPTSGERREPEGDSDDDDEHMV